MLEKALGIAGVFGGSVAEELSTCELHRCVVEKYIGERSKEKYEVWKSVARESVERCCRAWDRSLREPCCGDVAECCEEVLQNVAEKPWRWL